MRWLARFAVCVAVSSVACGTTGAPDGTSAGGGTGLGGGTATGGTGGSSNGLGGSATGGSTVTSTGGSTTISNGGAAGSSGGAGVAGQGGVPPTTDSKSHVMTWVPPYHVNEAKTQLAASFGGLGMADGLSFLALQFWIVNGATTRLDQVSEADITWFHDWAHQHNVKILLCVDNNTGSWDWPAAVSSFRDNKAAFAAHLQSEVMTRGFDGVDLDLEGIVEATGDEQTAYIAFAKTLADGLHAQGKVLTADSFFAQWNAPNWNWWPDLLPIVDGITSMGYEQSGLDTDYPQLVAHASVAPKKLMIGVPSYFGTWTNHTVTEQLGWLVQQGQVGTAIWDASLTAPEWQQRGVWEQLQAIKSR